MASSSGGKRGKRVRARHLHSSAIGTSASCVITRPSDCRERPWCVRRTSTFFAIVAIALTLVAGTVFAQSEPRHGGILDFAVTVEPKDYDCYSNTSFAFLHPVAPHYSTLLKFDAANYPQIIGDLAKSWAVSADRKTYTFKLWPNVLFHDGSPLTSADVKASYERLIHPPQGIVSARRIDYGAISDIANSPIH